MHRESFAPHPDEDAEDVEDWTRDPHVVDGGGDWYRQVYYDPGAGTFKSLTINGES